ncbi:hypothetical protein D3Z51_08825 [Clostridiaceae bacterium]|nr:hypothetical protein [Clostridiaceae bacterium]RKI14366.1 hypothetical protein D7V81_08310 [bacterium 1XD21-70]
MLVGLDFLQRAAGLFGFWQAFAFVVSAVWEAGSESKNSIFAGDFCGFFGCREKKRNKTMV